MLEHFAIMTLKIQTLYQTCNYLPMIVIMMSFIKLISSQSKIIHKIAIVIILKNLRNVIAIMRRQYIFELIFFEILTGFFKQNAISILQLLS